MDMIDLRSDTVTWPTPAMRQAMATAAVGDDVFGDDPTVNALEVDAAAMLGKEAGLFVASGTMGNLVSTLTHCTRGDEMIVGRDSHIVRYEAGSHAALGGIQPYMLVERPDGTFDLDAVRAAVRSDNEHHPISRLICLENTHGGRDGAPLPVAYARAIGAIAREHGLAVHVDGARLFNAAAALGVSARTLVEDADSVSVCLSKGLCAPVGSVVVGSRAFIRRARRTRKALGGGMRQVGILAAAGQIALRDMSQRVGEDHATARQLAEGLAALPFIEVDLSRVQTNMVFFTLAAGAPLNAATLAARLKAEYNILMRPIDPERGLFRAVTHYYITPERVTQTLAAVGALLGVGEGVIGD